VKFVVKSFRPKNISQIVMNKYNIFQNALYQRGLSFKRNESLGKYSTIKVGGNADFLVLSETSDQLKHILFLARECETPFIILGKGSNVIISDEGYKGLVIINTSKNWEVLDKTTDDKLTVKTQPRFESDFSGINKEEYDSSINDDIIIRVDSGVGVNYLMHELYKQNITGLQWFSGIPATVGGAMYMNMHGGEFFFGNLVRGATLIDGIEIKKVSNEYFQFDYDWSILHQTGEIILEAELCLTKGNLETAVKLTKEWAQHKAQQPKRSAGCIFRNLSRDEKEKLGLPTTSVGYLIDKELGLKGRRIGDAVISEKHAAFIENLGQASANDIYTLTRLIKQKAKTKFGLDLQEEVQFIGKF